MTEAKSESKIEPKSEVETDKQHNDKLTACTIGATIGGAAGLLAPSKTAGVPLLATFGCLAGTFIKVVADSATEEFNNAREKVGDMYDSLIKPEPTPKAPPLTKTSSPHK